MGRVHVVPVRDRRSRPGVALRFSLPRAARIVIVVRGPLPSCELAGRFAARGKRGANQIRFFGRIRGRELVEGAYVLAIRTASSRPQRVAVGVIEDGARALSPAEAAAAIAACTARRPLALTRGARLTAAAVESVPAEPPRREPPARGTDDRPFRVVLPEIGSTSSDGELPLAVGIAALALLGLAVVGIVVFLVRFFWPGSEL